ncbi:hypothetical protein 2050H1_153 [Serratia phage 2050H1]|uniref:Uncharacterized protein n=1 Tax=Serratia phage 2050H1 TaxID=2024250 RepID=A0A249Y2L9_9CAUD|nr:hypothetical protein 2050H1_153 [Serratia phage 2050H1]
MKDIIQLLRQMDHFPRPIRDMTAPGYKDQAGNSVIYRVPLPDGRVYSVQAEIHVGAHETETRIYDVIEIDPKELLILG